MTIFLNILFLVLGLVFLVKGADMFVNGASGIAKKLKISPFIIGATIVAIGTSLPELAVSVVSAIRGSTDMALGNVVGSNMFNMLMALGVTALICPAVVKTSVKKVDSVMMLVVTSVLVLFSADRLINGYNSDAISRTESLIFVAIYAFYMFIILKDAKKQQAQDVAIKNIEKLHEQQDKVISQNLKNGKLTKAGEKKIDELVEKQVQIVEKSTEKEKRKARKKKIANTTWFMISNLLIGLAGVVFGGECVSSTAKFLALEIGMSEMLVGATIVAIGTSLPELMVSIIAARNKETDMALGNVIGSSIANITLVLGFSGVIKAIPLTTAALIDLIILLVCTIIVCVFIWCGKKIDRKKGVVLILLYVAYIVYSCIRN